jgi:hypothetical protein
MKVKQVVLIICLCFFVSAISITGYHNFFALKIVALDSTLYLQKIQAEYAKGAISKTEVDKRLESLSTVIKDQPANRVILMSDMVVSKNVKRIKP